MSEPENSARKGSSFKALSILPWLLVCATIAYVAHLAFWTRPSGITRRLWLPVVVETNGAASVLAETRQMEFWTPSVRTKEFLSTNGGGYAEKEQWQAIASDDTVKEFGMLLHTNQSVYGYRRVEEWGQGRTGYKPGWWWTVNVDTNYTVEDLARVYRKFWNTPQTVFVEVIDNRGSDDK